MNRLNEPNNSDFIRENQSYVKDQKTSSIFRVLIRYLLDIERIRVV